MTIRGFRIISTCCPERFPEFSRRPLGPELHLTGWRGGGAPPCSGAQELDRSSELQRGDHPFEHDGVNADAPDLDGAVFEKASNPALRDVHLFDGLEFKLLAE